MASTKTKAKAGPNKSAPVRPLWYLRPGGHPVAATSKKIPMDAIAWAHEGDSEWTPMGKGKNPHG